MTLNEALALHEGDLVTHPAKASVGKDGALVRPPMRITRVWINDRRTIVMVRINAVAGQDWLDATAYDRPPKGLVFDKVEFEWTTPDELKARKESRRNGVAA